MSGCLRTINQHNSIMTLWAISIISFIGLTVPRAVGGVINGNNFSFAGNEKF
jgi:hypothetical protein